MLRTKKVCVPSALRSNDGGNWEPVNLEGSGRPVAEGSKPLPEVDGVGRWEGRGAGGQPYGAEGERERPRRTGPIPLG